MILFRADGNEKLGTGHIMRCLSIADAFRRAGKACAFVLAEDAPAELIKSRGHEVRVLGTDHRDMESELEKLTELIAPAELVIVDSYYVTKNYLRWLRSRVRTAYIDDLADFAYPVDTLINYNIYADRGLYERLYAAEEEKLPQLILGTEYAPLRPEFRQLPPVRIKEKCTDILISTGGADPVGLGLKTAGYISEKCSGSPLRYHLLIGALNRDKAEIEKTAAQSENIEVHYNVARMSELIRRCDIAVSAAGSTLYEICACGVPMMTYTLADNQLPGAKGFAERGLAPCLGDLRDAKDLSPCFKLLDKLSRDFTMRSEISERMRRLVDGLGADRICSRLK